MIFTGKLFSSILLVNVYGDEFCQSSNICEGMVQFGKLW